MKRMWNRLSFGAWVLLGGSATLVVASAEMPGVAVAQDKQIGKQIDKQAEKQAEKQSEKKSSGDKGQEDLDKATELQLNAETLGDLERVIDHCEKALAKGLGGENEKFAKLMLTSTLLDHADRLSSAIFERQPPDPRWQTIRSLALVDLDKALKHDPKMAEAHMLRARLHALPGGDRAKGLSSADEAIKLFAEDKPELSKAYLLRGQFSDDAEQRLKDFGAAIEADPGNAEAWQARALHFVGQGEHEKAQADFEKLLAKNGNNVMARLAYAETLAAMKKYDDALKQAELGISARPDVPLGYLLKAEILLMKEDTAAALESLNKALEIEPRDIGALLTRARLLLQTDRLELAREDVSRALQLRPGLPQALLLRAAIYADQKKYAEAIGDVRELLKRDPDNRPLRLQAAQFYVAGGWPRHAIHMLGKVLEQAPDDADVLQARGDALLSIGRHADAVKDYDKALEIAPDDSGVLNNLAWVLATSPDDKVRNPKRAIELGLKACELTGYKAPHILSTLASGYAEQGDFETAIKWSSKAVELGKGETKEQLSKELENYRQKKPWREKQETEEKPNPPALDESLDL